MQISVELQEKFSCVPNMIAIILLGIAIVVLIVLSGKKKVVKQKETLPKKSVKNLFVIKQKYDECLLDLENKYMEQKISCRLAYQELSKVIRQFVYEMTGIRVQNYTLEELKRINMPELYEVIAECYGPEFAAENNCNLQDSIKRARMVVEEWS